MTFTIEIVYALPQCQTLLCQEVSEGATLWEGVVLSGILKRYPELESETVEVGVFAKRQPRNYLLRPGDRVEFYRPLLADPKVLRRVKAKKG